MGSDIGGIPEIAGPETGSSLFRCGDAAALASAIVKTWEQQNDLRFLRAKARETYETRFRPEIHLDGYMKIINES
jgi:glycosyltransferase involved in cell wall biosynthesis